MDFDPYYRPAVGDYVRLSNGRNEGVVERIDELRSQMWFVGGTGPVNWKNSVQNDKWGWVKVEVTPAIILKFSRGVVAARKVVADAERAAMSARSAAEVAETTARHMRSLADRAAVELEAILSTVEDANVGS